MEPHNLALHMHEISLAFISIFHLTFNTHLSAPWLISFRGVGHLGSSPGGLEVGKGKLQTQIQNLGKDAVRPEDPPVRTQMAQVNN